MTERRGAARVLNERILVRAPSGDDAVRIAEVLGREGCDVVPLQDLSSLIREWERGAGVLVIATEALNEPGCCTSLRELLDTQEPWSEIPVVLLGGSAADEVPLVDELLGDRAQLLILERPLGMTTFVSAVEFQTAPRPARCLRRLRRPGPSGSGPHEGRISRDARSRAALADDRDSRLDPDVEARRSPAGRGGGGAVDDRGQHESAGSHHRGPDGRLAHPRRKDHDRAGRDPARAGREERRGDFSPGGDPERH